jgi:hypothetical protein
MKRWIPNYQYLLKSHIDFLMMTATAAQHGSWRTRSPSTR